MDTHPIVPFWLELFKISGVKYVTVCIAADVSPSTFSRWQVGSQWPGKQSVIKFNQALGVILGMPVDNSVDKLWISGGKLTAAMLGNGMHGGAAKLVQPQLVLTPKLTHKLRQRKHSTKHPKRQVIPHATPTMPE